MKIKNRKIINHLAGVTAIAVSCTSVMAKPYLDGDLNITGFVRAQTAISTTNDKNPANAALGKADNPDFNLNRVWGIADFDYRPESLRKGMFDSVRLFSRIKFAYDLTEDLSGGIDEYDAFPASNNLKDRGTMMNASNDTASAEIWELFVDVRKGNFWTRLGRQNIVWGESDGVRLLDVVNPLDNAWHPFEGGGELFDHRRIPLWMARFTYQLPIKDMSVDFFYNPGDFVPTVQADIGAPFNVNPLPRNGVADPADAGLQYGTPDGFGGFVPSGIPLAAGSTFITADDTNDRRGDDQWGIRLLGSVGSFNYTLNYLSLIDQDGVTSAIGSVPVNVPAGPFPGAGAFVGFLPVLEVTHERLDIAGASFNWYSDSIATVFRGEMSYTFDKPFAKSTSNLVFGPFGPTNPQDALGVVHRDEMKIMLGIDRPTFIFSKTRTMNISAQVIYTEREKINLDTDINGLPARKDETQLTLSLSQPFYGDQLFFEFFGLVDLDDGYWLQPQVRWQPGDNWRVWAYYNAIGGSEERSIAAFSHTDELNLAVSYQF
ncbi:hypothetical protein Q91_0878 [Cycloclasticus sp. P1]|nr:hypothetical protein Q91_0878 [Cycloclasticus sp. P1]